MLKIPESTTYSSLSHYLVTGMKHLPYEKQIDRPQVCKAKQETNWLDICPGEDNYQTNIHAFFQCKHWGGKGNGQTTHPNQKVTLLHTTGNEAMEQFAEGHCGTRSSPEFRAQQNFLANDDTQYRFRNPKTGKHNPGDTLLYACSLLALLPGHPLRATIRKQTRVLWSDPPLLSSHYPRD